MDGAERWCDESPPTQGVQQTGRGHKISVEHLEQRQHRRGDYQSRDPGRPKGAGECCVGAELLANDAGPGIHPGNDADDHYIEQPTGQQRHRDEP